MSKERRQAISGLSRRDLIHNALVLAAARLTAPFAGSVAAARLAQSPFRLGVASGGDIHAHFVNRVLKDWKDPQSATVAPEFVCTSISSNLRNLEPLRGPGSGNERAIVDLDCRHHGYVVCDVTKDDFQVAVMRVTPNAFVGSIAEAKAEVGMR